MGAGSAGPEQGLGLPVHPGSPAPEPPYASEAKGSRRGRQALRRRDHTTSPLAAEARSAASPRADRGRRHGRRAVPRGGEEAGGRAVGLTVRAAARRGRVGSSLRAWRRRLGGPGAAVHLRRPGVAARRRQPVAAQPRVPDRGPSPEHAALDDHGGCRGVPARRSLPSQRVLASVRQRAAPGGRPPACRASRGFSSPSSGSDRREQARAEDCAARQRCSSGDALADGDEPARLSCRVYPTPAGPGRRTHRRAAPRWSAERGGSPVAAPPPCRAACIGSVAAV